MTRFDIDVVIATSNSERYLEECLLSVVKQFPPVRAIHIVDNASTDSTREIAARFESIHWHTQSGHGLAQAWNQGIRATTAEVIAMIDSDDYWAPNFLSVASQALHIHPSALCAVAMTNFFVDLAEVPAGFREELEGAARVGWMPGVTLFRREVFERVGMFPEDLLITSDIDWFARFREMRLPHVEVPIVGLNKRIHGMNLSLNANEAATYRREILRIARTRRK